MFGSMSMFLMFGDWLVGIVSVVLAIAATQAHNLAS